MATNNPIELLVALGVNNTQSNKNIQSYLTELSKNLKLDVVINPTGSGTFDKFNREAQSAYQNAEKINKAIGGMGKNKPVASGAFAGLNQEILKSIKSVEDLKKYLEANNMKYTLTMGYDKKGVEYIKKVTTDVKNEFGELSKLTISPKIDSKGLMYFQQEIQKITNTDTHKLSENIRKANSELTKMQQQGKLASNVLGKFSNAINGAKTNQELERIVDNLKMMNMLGSHDTKISSNLLNTAQSAQFLQSKLDRLLQTYNIKPQNGMLSSIRKDIEQINSLASKTVKTSQDMKDLALASQRVSKGISELANSFSHMQKFNNTMKDANNQLVKMKESALFSTKEIKKFESSLSRIKVGELKHVNNLLDSMRTKMDKLSNANKFQEDIQKQKRALKSLEADMIKTQNVYKRSFDPTQAAKLRQEIERIGKTKIQSPIDLKNTIKQVDELKVKIKQFHSESASASKNNMGVIDAFKVAMERFPIWINLPTVQNKLL